MSLRKLSDQIVEDILSQLGSGQLGEGSTVPSEMTLCATYNVTRGVVREAIRSLDAKGFIKVSQGMGTVIAPLHEWNVLDPIWVALNSDSSYFDDLQTTREMFEPEIAALAARNATPDNLKELEDILEEQKLCLGDAKDFAQIDIAWHAALARATQNPILNQLHNSIANLGIKVRIENAKCPNAVEHATYWHDEIMRAVTSGDSDLAKAAMRMHMNQVRADLEIALQSS
ncbi:FadR Transcriptional regulators [Candidatus Planktophila versatilis]|uniref:FadR/GntR family transcriptional regulator n=1 Tax=Candidatus Planktophila versatilis TaxID=1884905 RepID=UPI003BEF45E1